MRGNRIARAAAMAWLWASAAHPTAAAPPRPEPGNHETIGDASDLMVVDCLLPGRIRRIGNRAQYVTARRPVRTTALECRIRGGEYTAYDRASYETALQVWQAAADDGDAEAQYYVGQIFERGLGREPDYAEAARWYRKAAESGYRAAMTSLGNLCEQGQGVETSHIEAMTWYRRAAGLEDRLMVVEADLFDGLQSEVGSLRTELRRKQEELQRLGGEAAQAATLRGDVKRLEERLREVRKQVELSRPARSEEPEKAPLIPAGKAKKLDFGRYHALVIGNSRYQHLSELPTAATDARDVAELLRRHYGFEVELLQDATRIDILKALNGLRKTVKPEDNLLIYYAGHSSRSDTSQSAYWKPVDSDAEMETNWLLTSVLTSYLELIPARHTLVIADAHYSATMTRGSIPRLSREMTAQELVAEARDMLQRRARLAMSSGSPHPLSSPEDREHSVFAHALLKVLEGGDEILDASEVYTRVTHLLRARTDGQSAPVPSFAPIRHTGHEGADFFFVPAGTP